MSKPLHWRARYALARAVASSICAPKLRLGRRRHDNYCDECGDYCGRYACDRLEFGLESLEPDATTKWERLRAMLSAEYERFCLECSVDLERAQDGGEQA